MYKIWSLKLDWINHPCFADSFHALCQVIASLSQIWRIPEIFYKGRSDRHYMAVQITDVWAGHTFSIESESNLDISRVSLFWTEISQVLVDFEV